MRTVAISGYFDPIHVGHLEYIIEAKKLGDKLIVIVNNNHQCVLKKGKPFMDENDRVTIVSSIKYVDEVLVAVLISNGVVKEYWTTLSTKELEFFSRLVTYIIVPSGLKFICLRPSASEEISLDCL